MQPNVKTALPLVHWAATASPSHLWEIPVTTVTNHPWAPSSCGHRGHSRLPSPAPLSPQHRGSAPLWGFTTPAPSQTLMPLLSLKTRASGHLACTPTTLVPGAGAAAWGWREALSPLTCKRGCDWTSIKNFLCYWINQWKDCLMKFLQIILVTFLQLWVPILDNG